MRCIIGSVSSIQEEQPGAGLTFGGNLRAAIFGVSDGLVSNTSLIMGVSGAFADARTVLITGAAGVLAGALKSLLGIPAEINPFSFYNASISRLAWNARLKLLTLNQLDHLAAAGLDETDSTGDL